MTKPPVILFVDGDDIPPPLRCGPGRVAGLLETLAADRITIVLCGYRTRAEVERARQSLCVFHPFICEGGAVAFVPQRYFGDPIDDARDIGGYDALEFAPGYETVAEKLRRLAERHDVGVERFSDMSVVQVAQECGLSLLDARLAKLREYSECFRLRRTDPGAEQRLLNALFSIGLSTYPAGGFWQTAPRAGFGPAVSRLAALYRRSFGKAITACLGGVMFESALESHVDVVIDDLQEVNRELQLDCPVAEEYDQASFLRRAHHRGVESRAVRARSS